ncbi:MAG: phosphodiester glycosidase family protein [Anaerolineae bacterium]|nr:phosphodiester glycosidase family protein [Anaerolineae bacterium]
MRPFLILCLLFGVLACGLVELTETVTPPATRPPVALPPTPAPVNTAAPTPTPILPDTGWRPLRPGLEQRTINLTQATTSQRQETITLMRLDPAFFSFDIAYRPGRPQTLPQWQAETGALLLVNGGYFTPEYIATGLIIVGGQASGRSYEGFGGMVVINGGGLVLRSLAEQPYQSGEEIAAALQSFPLLVRPGGGLGFPDEDNRLSRRTVIAQDNQGRVLFLVAPLGGFTLHQLSQWLVNSDLDLHIALNLDGGASTGLYLADPLLHIPAFDLLPTVLTATPRE